MTQKEYVETEQRQSQRCLAKKEVEAESGREREIQEQEQFGDNRGNLSVNSAKRSLLIL